MPRQLDQVDSEDVDSSILKTCILFICTHLSIYSSFYLHRVLAKLLNQVESADVDPSILKAFMRTPAVESMAGILCV